MGGTHRSVVFAKSRDWIIIEDNLFVFDSMDSMFSLAISKFGSR